jgi:hypothetical protein
MRRRARVKSKLGGVSNTPPEHLGIRRATKRSAASFSRANLRVWPEVCDTK